MNSQTTAPYVIKRDGTNAEVRFDKITDRNADLCTRKECGRPLAFLTPRLSEITQEIARNFVSGCTTHDLDLLAARVCGQNLSRHRDYGDLAARILVSDLQKRTPGRMADAAALAPRLSQEFRGIVARAGELCDARIDHDRDFRFDLFGIQTMARSYLMRDEKGEIAERPQIAYMRVALTATVCQADGQGDKAPESEFAQRLARAFRVYDLLSTQRIAHASPTMFNAGTSRQQLASCNLLAVDDDLETLLQTEMDAQMMSKWGAGIGINITPMRASGQPIRSTGGVSSGIHRYVVKLEAAQLYVNQGGRRPGAYAMYLEAWHADVQTFLELGRHKGGLMPNAPELKYALWVPDVFMEAVVEELEVGRLRREGAEVDPARAATAGDFYLFSPDVAPGLDECHGSEFRALYRRYVEEKRYSRVVKASVIAREWFKTIAQSGTPYILFKDHINAKSNLSHVRTIRSSNLCAEITIPSWHDKGEPDKAEYGVCILGAIPLGSFVAEGAVDWAGLIEAADALARNLDHTIDISYYPVEANRRSSLRMRAIAVGVIGFADVLAKLRIGYGTRAARELDAALHAAIYFGAMRASTALGRELGNFPAFDGCAAQQGLLQPDLWVKAGHLSEEWASDVARTTGGSLTPEMWTQLRESCRHHLRNGYVTADMPTATSSQVTGQNECFEPFTANLYARKTLAGEFTILNRYLVEELEELKLWDDEMRADLIKHEGSVQRIGRIPAEVRRRFRTARELDQRVLTLHAAARNPFLSQTQSLNYYFEKPILSDALTVLVEGWRRGLTTGSYYMHMQAASGSSTASAIDSAESGCGGSCAV